MDGQRLTDEHWMKLALAEAKAAAELGEVPVGAVLVKDNLLLSTGRNTTVGCCDPAGHAEINALRAGALVLGNYRLTECTLYVTLEPCAMCCGAILNARLGRLVFGAAEPKTGAVGSVVNLLESHQLNHHTSVSSGVLARECAAVLGDFFLNRRFQSKKNKKFPLRDDALRTPEHAFVAVPDFSHQSSYISDLPSLDGLRMHYVDSGPEENKFAWLCLHGPSSWSFVFQNFLNSMPESERVVLIDMIGFGKSDKPKREKFHQLHQHRLILRDFVDRLGLKSINVVLEGWHSGLLMSLCEGISPLICSFLVLPEGRSRLSVAAFDDAMQAPFPDKGYKAGVREFSRLLLEFKKEKNPDFQNN